MRRKGMFLGFLLLLILASGVFLISQLRIVDESLLKGNWDIFQEKMLAENSYIEKMDVYGNSPSICIRITVNETITNTEMENIFLQTREYWLIEEMFSELVEYHHDSYGGTMHEIYIVFTHSSDLDHDYPTYFSTSDSPGEPTIDSFKEWYVDVNGVLSEYVDED